MRAGLLAELTSQRSPVSSAASLSCAPGFGRHASRTAGRFVGEVVAVILAVTQHAVGKTLVGVTTAEVRRTLARWPRTHLLRTRRSRHQNQNSVYLTEFVLKKCRYITDVHTQSYTYIMQIHNIHTHHKNTPFYSFSIIFYNNYNNNRS